MRTVVFLGPTLRAAEAQTILDAIYLPPAGQADLLSAIDEYIPDVIGLIDGTFLHTLSVWHKEILYALERGIRVYGASSMGALRAAETSEYGMLGIGEIYRMFASGELIDDDEVALAHGSVDDGYVKLSEPMVNVRATFRQAEHEGIINNATFSTLTMCAKEIYFQERTFPEIFRRAAAAGVNNEDIAKLEAFSLRSYVDLKRSDAIELLMTVRDLPEASSDAAPIFSMCHSYLFNTLYNRDRAVRHNNTTLPLSNIANHAALHMEDFADLNFAALNRSVAVVFASVVGLDVTNAEIQEEATAYRTKNGLLDEAKFLVWQKQNDLTLQEFDALVEEVAICRRLHRWLLTNRYADKSTRMVLDELRLNGQYRNWAERAAFEQRVVNSYSTDFNTETTEEIHLDIMVREHLAATRCIMDRPYPSWSSDAGFHSTEDLKVALIRARRVREVLDLIKLGLTNAVQPASKSEPPSSA